MTKKFIIIYQPDPETNTLHAISGQFQNAEDALDITSRWDKVHRVVAVGEFGKRLYTVLEPRPAEVTSIPWKGE